VRGGPADVPHHRRRAPGAAADRDHAPVHVVWGVGSGGQLHRAGVVATRQPGGTGMNGPIRRLAMAVFAAMAVLVGFVTWIQAVRADDLRSDPRNARGAI